MTNINHRVKRFATNLRYVAAALILGTACHSLALAQEGHDHTSTAQKETSLAQQASDSELINTVRQATERFKDVAIAQAEGYALQFGCVTGPDSGAMGLHYVKGDLVNKGVLDATRPQIVIYEPLADGSLKLIGADFLVLADQWNTAHTAPPQLMGHLFHLFEFPNRFGLPAFYTLHVWAWKDNPKGAFTNWHPNVSCQSYTAQ